MSIVDALIAELDDQALAQLAEKLRPYLAGDDGWLGTRDAATYAGCSLNSLRHAMANGEVEFTQHVSGGKAWFKRSALDRWRNGGQRS